MKKALGIVVLVAIAVVFIATGCKRKGKSEDKYRIAVIPKGTTHVFWKSIHAGAVGLELNVIQRWLSAAAAWAVGKGPSSVQ